MKWTIRRAYECHLWYILYIYSGNTCFVIAQYQVCDWIHTISYRNSTPSRLMSLLQSNNQKQLFCIEHFQRTIFHNVKTNGCWNCKEQVTFSWLAQKAKIRISIKCLYRLSRGNGRVTWGFQSCRFGFRSDELNNKTNNESNHFERSIGI